MRYQKINEDVLSSFEHKQFEKIVKEHPEAIDIQPWISPVELGFGYRLFFFVYVSDELEIIEGVADENTF